METKALSLIAAYEFGKSRGLEEDVNEIKTMAIEELAASTVRRGYIAALFKSHSCLDEFIDTRWPHGRTPDGNRRLRYYESLRQRHLDILTGYGEGPAADDEEDESSRFALEAHLRDYLARNLTLLEPGLELFESGDRKGVEYPIDGGRIDVLAVDESGKHAVIELKLSRGRNKALGQLLFYMGWANRHLSNPPCRGIIVAEEIGSDLQIPSHGFRVSPFSDTRSK